MVLRSDYASSAVAMFDRDLGPNETLRAIDERWLDSGAVAPIIVPALSGDVVLPRDARVGARVLFLDRFLTDVLSVVSLEQKCVVSQLDVRGEVEGARTAFSPNAMDAVAVDGGFWVTRHNPNLGPDAAEFEGGNDVVFVMPNGIARQIELEADLDVTSLDGGTTRVFARPQGIAWLEDPHARVLVVGLARLSIDFQVTGPGAIAVIDDQDNVHLVDLPGLANCGEVASDQARANVFVLCRGATFVDGHMATPSERRASAGVVQIVLDNGAPIVRASVNGASGIPVPSLGPIAIGSDELVYVAEGRNGGDPDRLVVLNLVSGTANVFAEAMPFSFGRGSLNASGNVLVVPDALGGSVRTFVRPCSAGPCGNFEERSPFLFDRRRSSLPPRQIAWIGG